MSNVKVALSVVLPSVMVNVGGAVVQEVTHLPPEHVCPAVHAVPVPVQVLVGALPLQLIAEQSVSVPLRQLSEVVLGIAVPQATEEALAQDGAGYQEAAR